MNKGFMKNQSEEGTITIDLQKIFRTKLWIIVLFGVLVAVVTFFYFSFFVTPLYSATSIVYVNNDSKIVRSSDVLSPSDIDASRSLADTVIVILKNGSIIDDVIKETGVKYTFEQLRNMITASSVDKTEVIYITVKSASSKEAVKIANKVSELLVTHVVKIIDGGSISIVKEAVENRKPVSPNIPRNTAIGMMMGMLVSFIVIVIFDVMDRTINDTEYLINTYNIPLIGEVPNLSNEKKSGHYGYKYKYAYRYGYGYKTKTHNKNDVVTKGE